MSDIQNIKSQIKKIKTLINQERVQDKKTINRLQGQMQKIDASVSNLDRISKKIKGGKLRSQKGGQCPFLRDMMDAGSCGKIHKKKRGGSCGKKHKKMKGGCGSCGSGMMVEGY